MRSFLKPYPILAAVLLVVLTAGCGNNGAESDGGAPPDTAERSPAEDVPGKPALTGKTAPEVRSARDIQWMAYEEGLSRAKTGGKKVFVNFYADWCRYCKQMEETTFEDKRVISYLNDNFVPVRIDSDEKPKQAAEFGVRGLPVSWFLTEEGDRIGNQPGYLSPDTLLSLLKFIHTDAFETMGFNEFLKQM